MANEDFEWIGPFIYISPEEFERTRTLLIYTDAGSVGGFTQALIHGMRRSGFLTDKEKIKDYLNKMVDSEFNHGTIVVEL